MNHLCVNLNGYVFPLVRIARRDLVFFYPVITLGKNCSFGFIFLKFDWGIYFG